MIDRRKFLFSLFCAPAIIRPGLLMPIKTIIPATHTALYPGEIYLPEWDVGRWVTVLGIRDFK